MSQKEETFEQKRIVQLSRELDSERDKYSKLAKDSAFISNKLKESQEEVEQTKEKLLEYQINNHQLTERMRETERECLQLRNNVDREERLRSQAEVENVRQRQKIDELKGEMLDYENKTKAILYERTNQLAEKDREIYKLREENIEIEKLYLDQREKQQRKQEKTLRELTRIFHQFEQFKRELSAFKAQSERAIAAQKKRFNDLISEINKRQDEIERRIRIQQQLEAELDEMRMRLEEVVIENSQKIIELYKYKYA